MKIAIMQPTYLPWLGYFDLIDTVDMFVFLDQVQFTRRSWQQRNRVKSANGLDWLTVPVHVKGKREQTIAAAKMDGNDFSNTHLSTLRTNYGRSPYFESTFAELVKVLRPETPWVWLADMNIALINWMCAMLGIQTPLLRSSTLGIDGTRSVLLARICEHLGADEYLSPLGSADYLLEELSEFASRGIAVRFHHYEHPTYTQRYPPFVPYASAIDLVFNEGPNALSIIRSGRNDPYSPAQCRTLLTQTEVLNGGQGNQDWAA